MGDNEYILGRLNDDDEIKRLKFQHDVWSPETFSLWKSAGISKGMVGMDAGSGPGFASIELANLVGEDGLIYAFDGSSRYLDYLNNRLKKSSIKNISTYLGDLASTDLPSAHFDFIFVRMVLLFIPDVLLVLQEFLRILKSGGILMVSDFYTHRKTFIMSSETPHLEKFLKIIEKDFKENGANLEVARTLPKFLEKVGFKIEEMRPACKIARSGSREWRWAEFFFRNFIPDLIHRNKMTPKDSDDFWNEWNGLSSDKSSFFLTPTFLNMVALKAG